jgi:hypothetical protein
MPADLLAVVESVGSRTECLEVRDEIFLLGGEFDRWLGAGIEAGRVDFVIDIRALCPVTSETLRRLLRARRQMAEVGARIALVCDAPDASMLRIGGFDSVFPLARTRMEALRGLAKPSSAARA